MKRIIQFLCLLSMSEILFAQSNLRVFQSDFSQTEFSIAVSPVDANRWLIGANSVSSAASEAKLQGFYYSTNGGQSWNGANLIGWGATQLFSADPSVCFDRSGNAYFCFIGTQNVRNSNRVLVVKSTAGGATWPSAPVEIPTNVPSGGSLDKPYLVVDNNLSSPYQGRVYVVFTGAGRIIRFVKSTNAGATFLPAADGLSIGGTQQGLSAVPVTMPNGTLLVVWNILPDGYATTGIGFNKSSDGGESFL